MEDHKPMSFTFKLTYNSSQVSQYSISFISYFRPVDHKAGLRREQRNLEGHTCQVFARITNIPISDAADMDMVVSLA
ncbi:hypothetical protein Bca101_055201 [Brassica carinata]